MTTKKGTELWKCLDCPNCIYNKELMIGRTVRCFYDTCGNEFVITGKDLLMAKIRCGRCEEQVQANLDARLSPVAKDISLKGIFALLPPREAKDAVEEEYEKEMEARPKPKTLDEIQNDVIRDLIRSESEQDRTSTPEKG